MIFNTSVSRFVVAVLGALTLTLFAALAWVGADAWMEFLRARAIGRDVDAENVLFTAAVKNRSQIPTDSTALVAEDSADVQIARATDEADRAVSAAVAALRAYPLPAALNYASAVESTHAEEIAQRRSLKAQIYLPKPARDLEAIDGWRASVHRTGAALDRASLALGNLTRTSDAQVAEAIQVRRLAWTIRDQYGLQCSTLRTSVESNQPPSEETGAALQGQRAVYSAAWRLLDEYLQRPGVSQALVERIATARSATQAVQRRIDSIVARLGGSTPPDVSGVAWTRLCDGPFNSILVISEEAGREAATRASDLSTRAERRIAASLAAMSLAIGLSILVWLELRRRLTEPLRELRETVARLSRGELESTFPVMPCSDEMGALAAALEDLRRAELEARRLQEATVRFTADASHQMRTPLSIVRSHLALLTKRLPRDPAKRAALADIEHAVARLQRLVTQLLSLARAETAAVVQADRIDLAQVVRGAAADYLPFAQSKRIDLSFESHGEGHPVTANAAILAELVGNLIDNAIRYTPPGGRVRVRVEENELEPVVEVEDNGPGIPAEERLRVTQRFYRLKRDQGESGSGLGLAIVESLAAVLSAKLSLGEATGGGGLRATLLFAAKSLSS